MTLNDVQRRAVLREYAARLQRASHRKKIYEPTELELAQADIIEKMWFDKQHAFFMSPHTRKVGFCTRRAGKTVGSALCIIRTLLLEPTSTCIYVAQTSKMARLLIWKELRKLVTTLELPFEFNETHLFMKHERAGGTLTCLGADREEEIDKMRGPKYKLAILDEAASFGKHFENMVIEVLGPALRDESGTLILIGTAGRKKEGLFYEASTGKRPIYEVHRWSLTDNTYLRPEARDLERIKEEEGLTDDDPRYIREYLGRWVAADSERVFSGFNYDRNTYVGELPEEHNWKYLLGCDFGWNDETAISLIAYAETSPVIYIPETWARKHALPCHTAAAILNFQVKYGVRRYIGDTGGYGKAITVQLAHDYGIMMQPAKKHEKLSFVEFMNSDFFAGRVKVHQQCKDLIDEFNIVVWNPDRTDVGKRERDDLAFSAVYGWRAARNSGAGKTTFVEDEPDTAQRRALRDKLAALKDFHKPSEKWHERYRAAGGRRGLHRYH